MNHLDIAPARASMPGFYNRSSKSRDITRVDNCGKNYQTKYS